MSRTFSFASERAWLALYFVAATLILFFFTQNWTYDDPYITYRYADNLSDGLGFVYNPGERTLSTTAPFFAVLLSVLRFIGSDTPRLAIGIGSASLAGGALFLWGISRALKMPMAGWAALLLYPTFKPLFLTIGSEAPLMLFFVIGSVYFYLKKRYFWMGVLLGLAVLTRGDAALAAGILGLDWTVQTWKSKRKIRAMIQSVPWSAVMVFLFLILLWGVPATFYFGSPLPVTLAAKRAQGLMDISTSFGEGLLIQLRVLSRTIQGWPEIILMSIGLILALVRGRGWLLLVGWTALYALAYTLLGVTNYFWYYAPLAPGIIAAISLALGSMSTRDGEETVWRWHQNIKWGAVFLLVFLAFLQAGDLYRFREFRDTRFPAYRAVGEWLTENTASDAEIGTLEVGIMGYYARPRSMVDFAGLIQPAVSKVFGPGTNYQVSARWAVKTYQPDYLVLQKGLFPKLETEIGERGCRIIKSFPSIDTGHSFDLEIYDCRG